MSHSDAKAMMMSTPSSSEDRCRTGFSAAAASAA